MNPRSNDCKAYALITTPSRRLKRNTKIDKTWGKLGVRNFLEVFHTLTEIFRFANDYNTGKFDESIHALFKNCIKNIKLFAHCVGDAPSVQFLS